MNTINLEKLFRIKPADVRSDQLVFPLIPALDGWANHLLHLAQEKSPDKLSSVVNKLAQSGHVMGIGETLNLHGYEIPVEAWNQEIKHQAQDSNTLARYVGGENTNPMAQLAPEQKLQPEEFYLPLQGLEIGRVVLNRINEHPHSHPDCRELLVVTAGRLEIMDHITKARRIDDSEGASYEVDGQRVTLNMMTEDIPLDGRDGEVRYWWNNHGQKIAASYSIQPGSVHQVTDVENAKLVIIKMPTKRPTIRNDWVRRELYPAELA